MSRLAQGGRVLGLKMPGEDLLGRECQRLLDGEGARQTIIRVTITGGSGGDGYWPSAQSQSRRILQRRAWPAVIERQRREGLRAIISAYRLGSNGPLTGLKHGNRLLQTLMARECQDLGAEEGLLLDEHGQLAEAISSNLLLVDGTRLLTPARPDVAGVGLAWLAERLGAELSIGSVAADRLEALSEVLVINSVAGIRPVVAVAEARFPPGPVARRLQSLWEKELFLCA